MDTAILLGALQKKPFYPCLGLDWFSQGWANPAAHVDEPLYSVSSCQFVSLYREEKVLPAAVIRDMLEEKIAQIEDQELRKVGRKERQDLKEQITDDLLPRAFVRRRRLNAFLDTRRGWLMVDSATANKAEGLVSALREVASPFPAALPRTQTAPFTAMTDWLLAGKLPDGLEFDSDCELKDSNGAVVRCSHVDLVSEEIRQHVLNGKQVTRMGLVWRERIGFQLTDTLQLKRLRFLDLVQEEASQAGEDQASLFEASCLLMSEELGQLVEELVQMLGGLEAR